MPDDDGLAPHVRAVLVAPLHMPSPRWSTRSVAEATSRSQSDVARVWARTYRPDDAQPLPGGSWRLAAVAVSPENSIVVLAAAGPAGRHVPAGPLLAMRSVRRPALQTLLAADLLLADERAAATAGALARDEALTRAVLAPGAAPVLVLTRAELPGLTADGVTQVVVPGAAAWQRLLEPLVRRCTEPGQAVLTALQHQLMQWARSGSQRFEWVDAQAPQHHRHASGAPPATARAVADEMFGLLLDRIVSGRLRGGDRITEADLARALRTSRSHVRDALRTLASDGLVDLEPHRGALVPRPQVADALETYAVRRALGTLVVRRAAQLPDEALAPVEQALERMLHLARTTNDAYVTGDADLDLQDVLADATGMRRAAPMFRTTTAQIKLYVAVMGLDYSYPIPDMCEDDIALVQHVRDHDEAAAVRRWNAKVDAATRLMTVLLRQSRRGVSADARPPAGTP